MKKVLLLIVVCLVGLPYAALAEIPRVLNYQGYVENASGVPVDGPGYFKFAIVNRAGDTTFWSNDGKSTTGDEPSNYIVVTVTAGYFSIKLGDTDINNMTVLDDTPFENQNIYVRVWFSASGTVFQQLEPDTQIASSAFAYKAQTVEEVPPGTVDWLDLTGVPEEFADGVDDVGITSESDPSVPDNIKDGISWAEVTGRPAGLDDGDQLGIEKEEDPTVDSSVKDGVTWDEVKGIPAGFADGIDNVGIARETDPQVGILQKGGTCTSDGKVINCRIPIQPTPTIIPQPTKPPIPLPTIGPGPIKTPSPLPDSTVTENKAIDSKTNLLSATIKEQQKQIEQLRKQIELLQNRIEALESNN